MSSIAIAAVTIIGAALALLQAGQGLGFILRLRSAGRTTSSDWNPKTLVVLCLRGADPFLRRCIEGLLRQDFRNYDVLLVIDHADDEAWRIAEEVIAAHGAPNARIEALAERLPSCSLKCSALLQAWQGSEDRYDVVAGIDADVVPHPTWLAELVAPLAEADIGAATGNRWYMPGVASCGALTRYFWNAAGVVPMYWYGIAWGGTLAIKTDVFRRTDYRRRVSQALCEDTMVFDVLHGAGLRLAFVPSLMMVNRESCTAIDFFSWMRRQTLVAQLYHSRVLVVTIHGLLVGAWFAAAAWLFARAAQTGDAATMQTIAITVGVFLASMFGLLPALEGAVRRIVRRRGEPTAWVTPRQALLSLIAGPLTLALYVAAVVSLLRVREIGWRGIRYRIDGPFQIRRLDDGVYRAPEVTSGTAQTDSL